MRSSVRTAIVTGASAGIGRELARQLVRDRGMSVLVTARRRDRLESLAAELPEGGLRIESGDLTDEAFRDRLWQRAMEEFPGGPDLLVNNAGIGHYAEFDQEDPAILRAIVELNIIAPMDLTRRALSAMKARGHGQVMFVSSVLGFVGLPYSSAYAASKHAINGLVRSLRYELAGSGVRVWATCPNRTESEFHAVALGQRPGDAPRRAPYAEPTDRVVRQMVRAIDRRMAFHFPGTSARWVVEASRLLPGPFDWFMRTWAPAHFRSEMERASGEPEISRPFASDLSPQQDADTGRPPGT
ncbi:SDR family NAD(P)-dependent oxidoreductase [Tautonia sociabilis]|uniref:SDR family NAD(P)-dependent oxidoreductase n=1 Tax=Tautonia sociabilis TaxID=2080755 RepID=A0A432MFV8_9BACT|nr:SDR family NAD(P)-dependent oxidoreductase [Tautonia sociabilis]RUL85013.1 SDR family NAD(P)-dependent oxidoreductase [Tautonia sociabilis]